MGVVKLVGNFLLSWLVTYTTLTSLHQLGAAHDQDCGMTVDVTSEDPILVDVTDIVKLCMRCVNASGLTSDDATWMVSSRALLNGHTSPDGQFSVSAGVLAILTPQDKLIDGNNPYPVDCISVSPVFGYENVQLFSRSK